MSLIPKIVCTAVLLSVFICYAWILKNNPVKTESLLFKEVNSFPELTFSKVADLETRLAAELDAIPIYDVDRIRNEEIELFMTKFNKEGSQVKEQDTSIRVIVLFSLAIIGIFFLICLGCMISPRWRFHEDSDNSDTMPIVKTPSQERKKNYQTEKY